MNKISSQTVTEIHDAGDSVVTAIDAGTTVHDQATVSGSGPTPTGTVIFRWFENGVCTGAPFASSSALALSGGVVDATGFTQTPLDATKSYSFQGIYSGDNTYLNSASACEPLIVVDAFITIASGDTNGITEPHAFIVHVEFADGSGFQAAQAVFPSITFPGGAPGFVDTSDCDDGTDAFGNCVVVINSNLAGTFVAHATVTFTIFTPGGNFVVTRSTDGVGLNSGDATKVYVAGSLRWAKVDENLDLLGGATFEVCLTEVFQTFTNTFVDVTDVCFDVTDNIAPDVDPDPGEFLLIGLVLGRYTVQETVAPPGFVSDPSLVQAPDMTLATLDVEITDDFVNTSPFASCTPGFWKNHPGLWDDDDGDVTTFETDDRFNSVFGVTQPFSGLDDEVELLEALAVSGGELMALNRHAVAALLNADSLPYPLTVMQVIDLYQDAVGFVAGPETISSALDTLARHNNDFECTLGGGPADPLGSVLEALSSSISSISRTPASWILGLVLSIFAGILIAYRRRRL